MSIKHLAACPRCGRSSELQPVFVQTWQDKGFNLSKRIWHVRSAPLKGYCPDCSRSVTIRRLIASLLNALPLWGLGAIASVSFRTFPMILLGLYIFYLARYLSYSWGDLFLFGDQLEKNLHEQVEPLKPDGARVEFPAGILLTLSRAVFYFVTTFILMLIVNGIYQSSRGSATLPGSSSLSVPSSTPASSGGSYEVQFDSFKNLTAHGSDEDCVAFIRQYPEIKAATNKEGNTVIHIAALADRAGVITKLVQQESANPDIRNTVNGFTPLHAAAFMGKLNSVRALLDLGVNVNETAAKNGETPLILAAVTGELEVSRALLEHGADVNAKTPDGRTALGYAKSKYHRDVQQLLESHGAADQ